MALDFSRVRALCFDVDGTLSDTDDLWMHRFENLLAPLHPLFPSRNTQAFTRWLVMSLETPGNLVYHWLDHLHLDDEVAYVFDFLAKHSVARKPRQFWVIAGVLETVARLHQKYPLSVVSARDERSTLIFLEQFDLLKYFPVVATSQTCRYTKPFPDPVQYAARQMGVEAHECLMIGDTTVDIRAGKAAGAQTVGVLCGFGEEKELRRAGADLILSSTADLADLLLSS